MYEYLLLSLTHFESTVEIIPSPKTEQKPHRVPAYNACASYHTHYLLLPCQIFAVQLDFIQRIVTQNRFTTKWFETCMFGMKHRHTIGQENRYITTFNICFYFCQNNTQSEIRKPRGKGRTLAVCLTRLSGYQSNFQFFG